MYTTPQSRRSIRVTTTERFQLRAQGPTRIRSPRDNDRLDLIEYLEFHCYAQWFTCACAALVTVSIGNH
jgi:hypothetical protein